MDRELKLSRSYRRRFWICSACKWRVRAGGRLVTRAVGTMFEAHCCEMYAAAPKKDTKQPEGTLID